jgi:hypothetical protein
MQQLLLPWSVTDPVASCCCWSSWGTLSFAFLRIDLHFTAVEVTRCRCRVKRVINRSHALLHWKMMSPRLSVSSDDHFKLIGLVGRPHAPRLLLLLGDVLLLSFGGKNCCTTKSRKLIRSSRLCAALPKV